MICLRGEDQSTPTSSFAACAISVLRLSVLREALGSGRCKQHWVGLLMPVPQELEDAGETWQLCNQMQIQIPNPNVGNSRRESKSTLLAGPSLPGKVTWASRCREVSEWGSPSAVDSTDTSSSASRNVWAALHKLLGYSGPSPSDSSSSFSHACQASDHPLPK